MSVVDIWREEIKSDRTGHTAMFGRLITDESMRAGWEAVQKKSAALGRDAGHDAMMLCYAAAMAFCGPQGFERLHPKGRELRLKEIAETALKLSRLVADTALDDDYYLVPRFDRDFWFAFYTKDADKVISLGVTLSDFLEDVARQAKTIADASDLFMGAPNAPKARRAYFARYMTRAVMKLYADKDLMRRTILSFVVAAFEDPDFGITQLSRLAPKRLFTS